MLQLLEKDPLARPDGALVVLNALIALKGAAPQGEQGAQPLPAITAEVATSPGVVRATALPGPNALPNGRRDDTIDLSCG